MSPPARSLDGPAFVTRRYRDPGGVRLALPRGGPVVDVDWSPAHGRYVATADSHPGVGWLDADPGAALDGLLLLLDRLGPAPTAPGKGPL